MTLEEKDTEDKKNLIKKFTTGRKLHFYCLTYYLKNETSKEVIL
jgi:hypothetical protein